MAARLSLSEEDLCCPVCCDIFRDPVVLKCTHSFCAACLQEYWGHKSSGRDCPLCRKESTDEPVVSLTLKNVCEAYIQDSRALSPLEEPRDPGELCSLHGEKLKLFCMRDQEPICVVCHTSRKHKHHECCPVGEAIVELKEEMKSSANALQEKWEVFEKVKRTYENTATHIQVQSQFVERRIREEFETLHHFLRLEEADRIDALKEEELSKSRQMIVQIEALKNSMSSLSDNIKAIEEEMDMEDISLLYKYKNIRNRAQCSPQNPDVLSGALVNVASHLGSLKHSVWKKMLGVVHYTPVTLDPNTAAPWLILSDDLTSVRDSDNKQELPENPERFDPDTGVLGSKGFRSGQHTWEVNVSDNTAWVLGVAKQSVQRKEKVSSVLKNGYLTVYFYHKMYFAGTSPLTRLILKKKPQGIRVLLDYDRGRLSFYDEDETHIYTFKHTLHETVFPYFWVGCKQCPLRIEPFQVNVNVAHHS